MTTSSSAAFTPTVAQQEAMADYLVGAVVNDATGAAEEDVCRGEPPSARYYLASLAPADVNLAVNAVRMGRATPASLGFEFEVVETGAKLTLSASASCYYKRAPTWEEQRRHLGERLGTADEYPLAPVFQRVPAEVDSLPIAIPPAGFTRRDEGRGEFATAFARVRDAALADPRVERRRGDERRERSVPAAAMDSPAAFDAWLNSVNTGDPVVPSFAARIHVAARRVGATMRVTVGLENESRDPTIIVQGRGRSAGQSRHDEARDHFLFRVSLSVRADPGVIVPIRMDLGPDAYRYSPDLPAYATNCGVREVEDRGALIGLDSVAAPVYTTRRALPRHHDATDYQILESNPLPALKDLAKDLRAYSEDPAWGTGGLPGDLAAPQGTGPKDIRRGGRPVRRRHPVAGA